MKKLSGLGLLVLVLSAGWVSAMDGIAISTHYTLDKANSVHFPRFGNLIRHDIKNDAVVESTPIYTCGDAGFVCISPLGDRVAFTKRDGSIVIMSIDGGEPTTLLKIRTGVAGAKGMERAVPLIQWPYGNDGKWIYYIDVPGELRRVHVDTKETEPVVRFNMASNELGLSLYARKDFGTFTCRPLSYSIAPIYDMSRGDGDLYAVPTYTENGSCGVSVSPDGAFIVSNNGGHNQGRIVDTNAKLKSMFTINQWAGAQSDGAKQWQFFRWSVNGQDWIAVSQGANMGFGGAGWDVDWLNAVLYNPLEAGKQIQLTRNGRGQYDIAGGLWVAGLPLKFALGLHIGEAPFRPPFIGEQMTGDWSWDYGDGTQGKDYAHTYAKAGNYAVKATQGKDVRYGKVTVKEQSAPRGKVHMLSGRHLLVLFDEPVQLEKGGVKLSLRSGATAKGCRILENPRELLIDMENPLGADDALTLGGVVDCAQKPNAVAKPLPIKYGGWPGNDDKLVFRWETADAHNRVLIDNDTRSDMCRIFPRGNARFGRNGVVQLKGGSVYSDSSADIPHWIMVMVRKQHAMTMEVVVHPAQLQQGKSGEPTGIFSSGNAYIAQEGDELLLYYTGGEKVATRVPMGKLADGTPQHIVAACQPGKIICYRNGQKAAEQTGDICRDLNGNCSAGGAQLGVTPTNSKLRWKGGVEGVALYARYMEAVEVGENYAAYAKKLKARPAVPQVEVQAELLAITETPRPIEIAPYREALVVYEYVVEKVLKGTLKTGKIRVAFFGVLNGAIMPVARAKIGESSRLALEAFSDHPELEPITRRDTLPEDFEKKLWVEAE